MNNETQKINVTNILQHRIEWWILENGTSQIELDDCSIEHIEKCVKDGYREGELCIPGVDGDTELRGWWRINNG